MLKAHQSTKPTRNELSVKSPCEGLAHVTCQSLSGGAEKLKPEWPDEEDAENNNHAFHGGPRQGSRVPSAYSSSEFSVGAWSKPDEDLIPILLEPPSWLSADAYGVGNVDGMMNRFSGRGSIQDVLAQSHFDCGVKRVPHKC